MSPDPAAPVTVLIDARNVLRSEWPNRSEAELVEQVRAWVEAVGVRAVLVFDRRAPENIDPGRRVRIVGSGAESADDWIVRAAKKFAGVGRPYRLVTSDRALRRVAGAQADDVVGGGTFARILRTLGPTSGPSAPSSRAERASQA